jgi:hypothetical protein
VTLRPRLATGLPFFTVALWLRGLSVGAGRLLDRTCVYESVGKIQVVQVRRVLLLFALVLGLSAVVASIVPAPEDADRDNEKTTSARAAPTSGPSVPTPPVRLPARAKASPRVTRRVRAGSSFALIVSVKEPGDVVVDDLGLRQSADPHFPAHFELLASPPGRHYVGFVPVLGERRVIGQLDFVAPATVTPRPRDR